jgi:hypothetical protein
MDPGTTADRLGPAARRLAARFGDTLPEATIARVLEETHEALLVQSTVTVYVPVLAERVAAARLAAVAAEQRGARHSSGNTTGS